MINLCLHYLPLYRLKIGLITNNNKKKTTIIIMFCLIDWKNKNCDQLFQWFETKGTKYLYTKAIWRLKYEIPISTFKQENPIENGWIFLDPLVFFYYLFIRLNNLNRTNRIFVSIFQKNHMIFLIFSFEKREEKMHN